MKCKNCDKEFVPLVGDFPYCGAGPELDAKQMSSQERDSFSGITIGPEQDDSSWKQEQQYGQPKVHFKKISFSSGIISTLILLVVIGLFIFVAMPLFAIIAIVLAVAWAFSSLFF